MPQRKVVQTRVPFLPKLFISTSIPQLIEPSISAKLATVKSQKISNLVYWGCS